MKEDLRVPFEGKRKEGKKRALKKGEKKELREDMDFEGRRECIDDDVFPLHSTP